MNWLRTNLTIIAAAAVLIILAFALGHCNGTSTERSRQNAAREEANRKAVDRDSDAKEKAAAERADDSARIANEQQGMNNVTQAGHDATPADPTVRGNCERLRRAGRDTSDIAACR